MTGHIRDPAGDPDDGATLQLGSVAYTLLMVPIRAAVLLIAIAIGFGLDLHASGIGPACCCWSRSCRSPGDWDS